MNVQHLCAWRVIAGTLPEPVMVLFAEGCESDNVAYVEGWYVVPEARGRGVGRALIEAAEGWARRQGCTELGSDAQLDNAASAAPHRALGFSEVGQIRCFRKPL